MISETPRRDFGLQVLGQSCHLPPRADPVQVGLSLTYSVPGPWVCPWSLTVPGRRPKTHGDVFSGPAPSTKKKVKNPSPNPTKDLGWVNRPEAMNPAYYLTTLNCKQTLLGDDLPDPLAGVTLGEVLVVETLEIFGWKFQRKLRWNLKISSKWKGHIFRNQQFFGFMWFFFWKVYFFWGENIDVNRSRVSQPGTGAWPRRVPGIENMVTTGIWAFKRPWWVGGPAFASAALMHRGYDVVETEPGRFEMVLPIEYPGVTIHGWKISECWSWPCVFFLWQLGKYTFAWPTRAFNSRVKVLMPEKFSVSELYLFFE